MNEPPIVRGTPPVVTRRPHPPQRSASKWDFILQNRPAMFGMLFCVTGFLGLPFLWRSPKFSPTEKKVWSVVVTLYTLVLIGIAAGVCWWSYSQITRTLDF